MTAAITQFYQDKYIRHSMYDCSKPGLSKIIAREHLKIHIKIT